MAYTFLRGLALDGLSDPTSCQPCSFHPSPAHLLAIPGGSAAPVSSPPMASFLVGPSICLHRSHHFAWLTLVPSDLNWPSFPQRRLHISCMRGQATPSVLRPLPVPLHSIYTVFLSHFFNILLLRNHFRLLFSLITFLPWNFNITGLLLISSCVVHISVLYTQIESVLFCSPRTNFCALGGHITPLWEHMIYNNCH